ncbi:MAG: hypothetical protein ACKE5M_05015 [Methylophilaceae bacterium]
MKKFIKDNLVLVLGLTLPLLLIVLFFFAAILPKMLSEPPQYEMLFASTYYQYKDKTDYILDFSVKNKQVVVKPKSKQDEKHGSERTERLFVYDGKSQVIREITIDSSQLIEGVETPLAEVNNMVIDSSAISPDGYTLDGSRYGGRGLINGLFGGGSRSHYRLVKGSVSYKLPTNQPHYYYNQLTFLGWVVKK